MILPVQHFTYAGLTPDTPDGTTNDTLQRFVSRLLVTEVSTSAVPLTSGDGQGVRVYPNPASTTAELELLIVPPNAHMLLRDALGRLVMQKDVQHHTTTFNLQTLPNGLYTLELRSNGTALHTRLAVQR